ncbi:unnamed protein product, partial [Gulo gulo]
VARGGAGEGGRQRPAAFEEGAAASPGLGSGQVAGPRAAASSMSGSAPLRSSSEWGLDRLVRLTTQWSVEDEEEAARERRRRERDSKLRAQDEDGGSRAPQLPEQETLLSLKPVEAPEPDEDEGFGDWSQKPEQQQQHWGAGEAPWGESPEGRQEEEDRPHRRTCGSQDGDERSPASVCPEELRLSPSSEPQAGPGAEETQSRSPEGTIQGSLGPGDAGETEEQHQKSQQPRTPSPLVLEGATEQGSPPLSPSTKLIDRTESLNRSIEKSNSVKKSQPALPISKIDERLEQYIQAVETAGRASKLTRQPSIELPSTAVASTKSRWETGEAQAPRTAQAPSCKDTVAGGGSKKNLWGQKGGSKAPSTMTSTPSGKRYKFVATGHGRYEKVLVDEGSGP